MKRILIDGRFIGVGDSMTRYTLELLKGILKLDHENEYTLLVRPIGEKKVKEFELPTSRFQLRVLDIPHYSLKEQTKLLSYLNKEKFDLVHFIQFNHPIFYRGKYIVTIHDLTLKHLKYNPLKKFAFNQVMNSAIKSSYKIITDSETTKKEIIKEYGRPKDDTKVVYLGVDHERFNSKAQNKERIADFKSRYGIEDEYIFYTGMWKENKNLKRLINAFQEIKNQKSKIKIMENLSLVIGGKVDKDEPEIIQEIDRVNNITMQQYNNKGIVVTGFIPENDLPTAYAGAMIYVIPSLMEGFGLPPLEAMACGTPVISSNISCMPEILGDASLYFNPLSESDIAKAIEKVASDENLRKSMREKGFEQAKKYSWDKTAEETLEVYKKSL